MKRISLLLLTLSTICLTGCGFTQQHEKDQFSKISECKKIEKDYFANKESTDSPFYFVYYSDKIDYCIAEEVNYYGASGENTRILRNLATFQVIASVDSCHIVDHGCREKQEEYLKMKKEYINSYITY